MGTVTNYSHQLQSPSMKMIMVTTVLIIALLNQIGGKHLLVETEDKPMDKGDKGADYQLGVWSSGNCVGKYDKGFKQFKTEMSRDKCLQVCTDRNARGCQFDQNEVGNNERGR